MSDPDDPFAWGRSDSFAFGVLLACIAWTACNLAGCGDSHTALEDRVLVAAMDAWAGAGLPEPLESCRIEAFRIERPAELSAFQKACSGIGRPPEQVRADACMRWRLEAPRARSLRYPAAIISPALREDRHAAAALHELLHALAECALGDTDAGHTDPRVWEGTRKAPRPDSVEASAERMLYGQ